MFRIEAIPEQASAGDQDDDVTATSPLGQALVRGRTGDTVRYQGPDGELQAEVVALRAPRARAPVNSSNAMMRRGCPTATGAPTPSSIFWSATSGCVPPVCWAG